MSYVIKKNEILYKKSIRKSTKKTGSSSLPANNYPLHLII